MDHDCGRPMYGTVVERGKIITASGGLYTVSSYDRDGVETPPITAFLNLEYQVGDQVYFFLFSDGSGRIICAAQRTNL